RTDRDGLTELLVPALLGVPRVRGRVDLHGGAEEREGSDAHRADVEHDAPEIEEDALTELDVRAVVAVKGRLQRDRIAPGAEQRAEDPPTLFLLRFSRGIQRLAEIPRTASSGDELRVGRIVELSGEHFLALGLHVSGAHGRFRRDRVCVAVAARFNTPPERKERPKRPGSAPGRARSSPGRSPERNEKAEAFGLSRRRAP